MRGPLAPRTAGLSPADAPAPRLLRFARGDSIRNAVQPEGCEMPASDADAGDAYQFEFAALDGGKLPLAAWRGRPVLIVNTASFCGYTPQYRDLEALWRRYRERGLVVLGVPSNDFGAQEPGSAAEIK